MDPLERIKAFLRQLEEGTCDEVVPTTHGVALQTPSLSLVWQLNAVRVDDTAADAAALSAEADLVQARLAHRKLVVHDEEQGRRLAAGLTAEGWNASRLLVMVRCRPPDREVPAGAGRRGEPQRRGRCPRGLSPRAALRLAGTGRGAADGDG